MESRKDDSALTADQEQLISKFNDIIKRRDHSQILKIIVQLKAPFKHSPLGALALEAEDLSALENCIALVKEAISLETCNYVAEQLKKQMDTFKNTLDDELFGKVERPIKKLDLNVLKQLAVYINLYFVDFIYGTALSSYALSGKLIIKLLDDYEKAHDAITKEKKNSYPDKELICAMLGTDFEMAEHELSTETKCLLLETLVVNKKLDESKAFLCKHPNIPLIEKAFVVYFKENQLELINYFIGRFFTNCKFKKNNILHLGRFAFYAALAGEVDLINEYLIIMANKLQQKTSDDFHLQLNLFKQEIDKFSDGYKLANLDLESRKINFIYNELFSILSTVRGPERQTHLFQKIERLSVNDTDLTINLLVDCLYKNTLLGNELWHKYPDQSTPTLKRGTLNQVLTTLHKLGVDIKRLPGCGSFSVNVFGFITACPSKVELEGKTRPPIIPMLNSKLTLTQTAPTAKPYDNAKEKEEYQDRMFKL